jgi:serine/threonine protein kinase
MNFDGSAEALPIGTTLQINGKYKIIDVLGQGGFGITYLAFFSSLQRKVAIKEYFPNKLCIRKGNSVDPVNQFAQYYIAFREKFFSEAKQLAQFKYEHIVKITDCFEENNTAYFVMEYIDGITLYDYVLRSNHLTEALSINFINQIGSALELIHDKDILHRDIKPKNVLIDPDGKATLIDFGAAREIVDTDMEHTAIFSEGFAPPEQYEKTGKKGPHIDVYGLGASLYYCLTGQVPISARLREKTILKSPIELNPLLSKELSSIVMKAMELNINDRYLNISKLLYELNTIIPSRYQNKTLHLTKSQEEAIKVITEFIQDESADILILTGALEAGKSKLISRIIMAVQNKYKTQILTIGSRLAERLRIENDYPANSIYSVIYDLNHEINSSSQESPDSREIEIDDSTENEIVRFSFPLKSNEDSNDTLYFVDEANLLSDLQVDESWQILGTGKLLTDFISYTEIRKNKARKIIFIGDDKELTRGNREDSALFPLNIQKSFDLQVRYCQLTDVIRNNLPDKIIDHGLKVYKKLEEELYNELSFTPDGRNVYQISRDNFSDSYNSNEIGNDKMFICYSNKQTFDINSFIRKLLKKTKSIEKGDKIILNNTINILLDSIPHKIYSGEFGEVMEASEEIEVYKQASKGKGPITLTFRRLEVFFNRPKIQTSLIILEDYLNSESKELLQEQRFAILTRAKQSFRDKNPDIKLYAYNLRSLLKTDEYFNTALIKYAYSLTCHRAQSNKWPYVFIDCETDQGKENAEYFRWIYTAIKCAKEKIYLLNAPKITPYIHLSLAENNNAFDEHLRPSSIIVLSDIEMNEGVLAKSKEFKVDQKNDLLLKLFVNCIEKLSKEKIQILNVEHRQYQEIYSFSDENGNKVKLTVHYNSKGQISGQKFSITNDLSKEIQKLLTDNSKVDFSVTFKEKYLKEFYSNLKAGLANENILINKIVEHNLQYEFHLIRSKDFAIVNIFYNRSGFITTMWPTKYNSAALLADLKKIIEKLKAL